jgi:hypothetical protein
MSASDGGLVAIGSSLIQALLNAIVYRVGYVYEHPEIHVQIKKLVVLAQHQIYTIEQIVFRDVREET